MTESASGDTTVDGTDVSDVVPDELFKVRVPKDAGDEIVLSNGMDATTYKVKGGVISPRSRVEAQRLLDSVPGAERV
jgi:hypothetical protein